MGCVGESLTPDFAPAELLRLKFPSASRADDCIVETDKADDRKLLIKRVSTGEVLFTGLDPQGVLHPCFSPDGQRVLSGNRLGEVKVWLQAARSSPGATDKK